MDKPVNLDGRRGMADQRDTEIRRDIHEVQADQAALRDRQEELENFLDAAPAATRAEAVACARYLLQLFAATLRLRTHADNGSSPVRLTISPASPSDRGVQGRHNLKR